jgi:hypothetical protein
VVVSRSAAGFMMPWLQNKPFDQFARELIAPPTAASQGYIDGIRWRVKSVPVRPWKSSSLKVSPSHSSASI